MSTPLNIQGVGDGTQQCTWETKLPIAVPEGAETAHIHSFQMPIVEGSGEDFPGLLGLKSTRGKQGVLETAPGKEMLTFPGPGGYKNEWMPGAQHFKLENAPSGRLLIPISDFDNVKKQPGGVAQPKTTFHTTGAASDPCNQ